MSDKGAFAERGQPLEPGPKHPGGRPHVAVEPSLVRQLREEGRSWRSIARALGIGTATAMRLYDGHRRLLETSQNSPQEVIRCKRPVPGSSPFPGLGTQSRNIAVPASLNWTG
jgi:hypothetical protein